MRQPKLIILGIIALAIILVVASAAFIVNEKEQVIITRFGKPIGEPITEPGLHFKTPFIEEAHFFDKRFLEWDGDPSQVPTKDKRFIWVDTYGRWRIKDPLLFFQRVRDERGAQTRLDDILDSETRNAIARHDLVEIIRSQNREVQETGGVAGEVIQETLPEIKIGRERLTRAIIEEASPKIAELGMELLDLRIKRIKFVEEVQKKIYERMITERKRIADKFRSEGQGEASRILGNKERELKRIQSEAYRKAEEIKGNADAKAAKIYSDAYNKNATAREFYAFIKTMETYEQILTDKDLVVLSTRGDLFKYLQKQK
ncbi:MAG: protease modulator HflC [Methanobacteriota archaeon]|nr:MAG: protease modulator HflC [Euryarchaeota archaeon]